MSSFVTEFPISPPEKARLCLSTSDKTTLPEPKEQHDILRKIDQRQDLLLEDLDRLNQRIVTLIELQASVQKDQYMASAAEPANPARPPEELSAA